MNEIRKVRLVTVSDVRKSLLVNSESFWKMGIRWGIPGVEDGKREVVRKKSGN